MSDGVRVGSLVLARCTCGRFEPGPRYDHPCICEIWRGVVISVNREDGTAFIEWPSGRTSTESVATLSVINRTAR